MSLQVQVPSRLTSFIAKLTSGEATDAIMRTAALTMGGEVSQRIHEKGEKADGTQIGTYDPKYIKQRVKKGWGTSTKVIIDFTDQLRVDFNLIAATPKRVKGGYALGFTNAFNDAKAGYMEKRYGRIWALTPSEKEVLRETIEYEINRLSK